MRARWAPFYPALPDDSELSHIDDEDDVGRDWSESVTLTEPPEDLLFIVFVS